MIPKTIPPMLRKTPVCLLTCLAFLLPAAARDADKGLQIRLFTVALQPEQGKVRIMAGDQPGPAFELPVFNLSERMPVAARKFKLVAATATPPPETPSLCDVVLPGEGLDFRVILVPKRDGTYQSFVVRGDDPKFASGDVFFINLSSHHHPARRHPLAGDAQQPLHRRLP